MEENANAKPKTQPNTIVDVPTSKQREKPTEGTKATQNKAISSIEPSQTQPNAAADSTSSQATREAPNAKIVKAPETEKPQKSGGRQKVTGTTNEMKDNASLSLKKSTDPVKTSAAVPKANDEGNDRVTVDEPKQPLVPTKSDTDRVMDQTQSTTPAPKDSSVRNVPSTSVDTESKQRVDKPEEALDRSSDAVTSPRSGKHKASTDVTRSTDDKRPPNQPGSIIHSPPQTVDPQQAAHDEITKQRAPFTDLYGPFVLGSDTCLEDARKRLEVALTQTRQLRVAFTERVYGKYRVCLRPPRTVEQTIQTIKQDAVNCHQKLKDEMASIKEEKEVEKREAAKLSAELEKAEHPISATVDNADQLMYLTAGLNLVILPEEEIKDEADLKGYTERGPINPLTGARVKGISQAACAAGEAILDRTRKAAAMRVERQRRRQLQLLSGDVPADGQEGAESTYSRLQVLSTAVKSQATPSTASTVGFLVPESDITAPTKISTKSPIGAALKPAPSYSPQPSSVTKSGRSRNPVSLSPSLLLSLNPSAEELRSDEKVSAATAALIARGVGASVSSKTTQQRLRHPHPDSLGGRRRASMNPQKKDPGSRSPSTDQPFLQAYLALTLPPLPATKERLERKPLSIYGVEEAASDRAKKAVIGVVNHFVGDEDGAEIHNVTKIKLLHGLRKLSSDSESKTSDSTSAQPATTVTGEPPSPDTPIDPVVAFSVLHAVGLFGLRGETNTQFFSRLRDSENKASVVWSSKLREIQNRIESSKDTVTSIISRHSKDEKTRKRLLDTDRLLCKGETAAESSKRQRVGPSIQESHSDSLTTPMQSIRGGGEMIEAKDDSKIPTEAGTSVRESKSNDGDSQVVAASVQAEQNMGTTPPSTINSGSHSSVAMNSGGLAHGTVAQTSQAPSRLTGTTPHMPLGDHPSQPIQFHPDAAQLAFLNSQLGSSFVSGSVPSRMPGYNTDRYPHSSTLNALHLANQLRHMHHPAAGDLAEYLSGLQQQQQQHHSGYDMSNLMPGATPTAMSAPHPSLAALGLARHGTGLMNYSFQERAAAARAMLVREHQTAALLGTAANHAYPQQAGGFPHQTPHPQAVNALLGTQAQPHLIGHGHIAMPPMNTHVLTNVQQPQRQAALVSEVPSAHLNTQATQRQTTLAQEAGRERSANTGLKESDKLMAGQDAKESRDTTAKKESSASKTGRDKSTEAGNSRHLGKRTSDGLVPSESKLKSPADIQTSSTAPKVETKPSALNTPRPATSAVQKSAPSIPASAQLKPSVPPNKAQSKPAKSSEELAKSIPIAKSTTTKVGAMPKTGPVMPQKQSTANSITTKTSTSNAAKTATSKPSTANTSAAKPTLTKAVIAKTSTAKTLGTNPSTAKSSTSTEKATVKVSTQPIQGTSGTSSEKRDSTPVRSDAPQLASLRTSGEGGMRFFVPKKPAELSNEEAQSIRMGNFAKVASQIQPSKYSAALEYLVAVGTAVPIPKALVLLPLKERLNTPGFKNAGTNSAPPIQRDTVVAVILVWLWANHESNFQHAFKKSGRIDVDPDCKWLIQAAVDTSIRELSLEIAESIARCEGAFAEASAARKGHNMGQKGNGPQNEAVRSALSKRIELHTASIVSKAIMSDVRLDRGMNSVIPHMQQLSEFLDEARLGALKAKSQERVLLATLIARKVTMSEAFSQAYVSSLVRSGEALGHAMLFETVQNEEVMASTMMPYDIFTDDSDAWEDPCKTDECFTSGLRGEELFRRAHARGMIQKSLRKLQDRHNIRGGASTYGPYVEPADLKSSTGNGTSSDGGGKGRGIAPRAGLKRGLSSIMEPPVQAGTGSALARSWAVYEPKHVSEPLEWDPDHLENMPYGRHRNGERPRSLSLSITARSGDSRNAKKPKRSMSITAPVTDEPEPTIMDETMPRSTHEIDWAEVAGIFQRVDLPKKASRSQAPEHPATKPDRTIVAPFVLRWGNDPVDNGDSESEEDLDDDAVLAHHQVVLDDLKAKLSAFLEARRKQQERRKSRNIK